MNSLWLWKIVFGKSSKITTTKKGHKLAHHGSSQIDDRTS